MYMKNRRHKRQNRPWKVQIVGKHSTKMKVSAGGVRKDDGKVEREDFFSLKKKTAYRSAQRPLSHFHLICSTR